VLFTSVTQPELDVTDTTYSVVITGDTFIIGLVSPLLHRYPEPPRAVIKTVSPKHITPSFKLNPPPSSAEINADMPVANAVYQVLWEKVNPSSAFKALEETLI
jgi:hypothetical protein